MRALLLLFLWLHGDREDGDHDEQRADCLEAIDASNSDEGVSMMLMMEALVAPMRPMAKM